MKGPLKDELKRMFDNGYTAGGFSCTAHPLSPTYEAAFSLYWDQKVKWLDVKPQIRLGSDPLCLNQPTKPRVGKRERNQSKRRMD